MIWSKVTAGDFRAANEQTTCINLLSVAAQQGGMVPLSEIAEFSQGIFESIEDFALLDAACVVRYKPNSNGQAGWQYSGSSNYTADEYAEVVRTADPGWKEGMEIRSLVGSLKAGLNRDIILTTVMDNSLGVRLIVDGLHRATALILIRDENAGEINMFMASSYKVSMIELRSRWAHILYPCDFLNLCARRGP